MEPSKATFRRFEGLVPDPKLRLQEQLQEVALPRFGGQALDDSNETCQPCLPPISTAASSKTGFYAKT